MYMDKYIYDVQGTRKSLLSPIKARQHCTEGFEARQQELHGRPLMKIVAWCKASYPAHIS